MLRAEGHVDGDRHVGLQRKGAGGRAEQRFFFLHSRHRQHIPGVLPVLQLFQAHSHGSDRRAIIKRFASQQAVLQFEHRAAHGD